MVEKLEYYQVLCQDCNTYQHQLLGVGYNGPKECFIDLLCLKCGIISKKIINIKGNKVKKNKEYKPSYI